SISNRGYLNNLLGNKDFQIALLMSLTQLAQEIPVNIRRMQNVLELESDNKVAFQRLTRQLIEWRWPGTPVDYEVFPKGVLPLTNFIPMVIEGGGVIFFELSSGCPFRCKMCSRPTFLGSNWKHRYVEDVIDFMKIVSEAGGKGLNLVDEELFGGTEFGIDRMSRLAKRIIAEKTAGNIDKEMSFWISLSVVSLYEDPERYQDKEKIKNRNKRKKEVLTLMKEAGFKNLFIGVEALSDSLLNDYGKPQTKKEAQEGIRILKDEIGISPFIFLIPFQPTSTIKQIIETLSAIKEFDWGKHIAYAPKSFIPMKGSQQVEEWISMGLIDAGTYDPETLAYDYKYNDPLVAELLRSIKDWEESQTLLLRRLKNITTGAHFSGFPQELQKSIEMRLNQQKEFLFDYLFDLAKGLDESSDLITIQKISRKYGEANIKAMLAIITDFEGIDLQYSDRNIMNSPLRNSLFEAIYYGVLREILRLNHATTDKFTLQNIQQEVNELFKVKLDIKQVQKTLDLFAAKEMIVVTDEIGGYQKGEKFLNFFNLPNPDLPRPAKEYTGGIDLNSDLLQLSEYGEMNNPFDTDVELRQKMGTLSGFNFNIIKIQPLNDLKVFLQ
ncbi:MAG: radical SAM protein, partial [Candidatus Omnitrophota bacterium]